MGQGLFYLTRILETGHVLLNAVLVRCLAGILMTHSDSHLIHITLRQLQRLGEILLLLAGHGALDAADDETAETKRFRFFSGAPDRIRTYGIWCRSSQTVKPKSRYTKGFDGIVQIVD